MCNTCDKALSLAAPETFWQLYCNRVRRYLSAPAARDCISLDHHMGIRGVGRILEGQARACSHAYRVGGVAVFAHAQTFALS